MAIDSVVVIGGGVIGLSTAYHLARKNVSNVVVLDKGKVGDGSSGRAAGIITGLLWTKAGVLARKKSLALYRELSQELKGYQFREVGCLNLFNEESWNEQERLLPLYRELDVPFEVMGASEISKRWSLKPPDDFIGLFDPIGGYSEPDEYIPALAQRCRELGVRIREREMVTNFIVQNGAVAGIETTTGKFEADAVVCTVYSWTLKLTEPLGIKWPVKAFVHQRYVTSPLPSPARVPAVNAGVLGGYVRPAIGNRILGGIETPERDEFIVPSLDFKMSLLTVDCELKHRLKERFVSIMPDLARTSWENESIGLLTFSIDGEPILGPVMQLPGFYLGVAFHSGGFAYNPVAGLLMAEYIVDGKTSIDVATFSPNRFNPNDVKAYLTATVTQRSAVPRRH